MSNTGKFGNFKGNIYELTNALKNAGVIFEGQWEEKYNSCHRIVTSDGCGINWSKTKGTIWLDGKAGVVKKTKKKISKSGIEVENLIDSVETTETVKSLIKEMKSIIKKIEKLNKQL